MKKFVKNLFNKIAGSIFINYKCICCGIETGNPSLVCDKCLSKMTLINKNVCHKCGSITEFAEPVCMNCYDKKYKFLSHKSCIIYDELSSKPVKRLKYYGQKYLAEPIAKIMYAANKEMVDKADMIVFVPMTKERQKSRGYNHTEEIAKELSKMSKIELVSALVKNFDTEEQAGLNFEKRTKNLKGSFGINPEKANMTRGKNILLIDDVFTTGSTANECSKVLLKAKANSVEVLTFLKTDPNANEEELLFWLKDY